MAFGLAAVKGRDVVDDGEAFVPGALVWGVVVGMLDAGDAAAPGDAGLSPRLLGLLSIVPARLLTILASFMATSSRAALRISFR